jgi:hypothetical protein
MQGRMQFESSSGSKLEITSSLKEEKNNKILNLCLIPYLKDLNYLLIKSNLSLLV